eukprot:3711842-Pleurochrysis_carterae.AAC.1
MQMLACAHVRECTCRRALRQDAWTSAEKQRLCELHQIYGNRWATIASFMPGRTNSAIKNLLSASLKRESSSPSPP